MARQPSPDLRHGERALRGVKGVQIIKELTYDELTASWVIHVRLTISTSSAFVPATTDWYVLIDPEYPIGLVQFFPAEQAGLHSTFRHMRQNLATNRPWRSGLPCLDRRGRWLWTAEFSGQTNEPVGKIRFYAEAALRWLECAAKNALTDDDEVFELPAFPNQFAFAAGFDESADRLARWQRHFGRVGRCVARRIKRETSAVSGFTIGNKAVAPSRWGSHISAILELYPAYWLALPKIPIIIPWDVPSTWGDLRQTAAGMSIDLDDLLRSIYRKAREARTKTKIVVFVGFPIPSVFDGPDHQMHWQPLQIPAPLSGSDFEHARAGDRTVWRLQLKQTLQDATPLKWGASENWSESRLRVRGALDGSLRSKKVALIGAGALGSALAEFLVREGVNDLVISDGDILEIGNLRRHTLTMDDTADYKSRALAKRLNAASPFGRVRYTGKFPDIFDTTRVSFKEADVIIDCTANENVIGHLAKRVTDGKNRWFFSGSFGMDAHRLFLYSSYGSTISATAYNAEMRQPIAEERERNKDRDDKDMNGAGCWNPVFPASWANVQVLAAEMLLGIERVIKSGEPPAKALETIPLRAA